MPRGVAALSSFQLSDGPFLSPGTVPVPGSEGKAGAVARACARLMGAARSPAPAAQP